MSHNFYVNALLLFTSTRACHWLFFKSDELYQSINFFFNIIFCALANWRLPSKFELWNVYNSCCELYYFSLLRIGISPRRVILRFNTCFAHLHLFYRYESKMVDLKKSNVTLSQPAGINNFEFLQKNVRTLTKTNDHTTYLETWAMCARSWSID